MNNNNQQIQIKAGDAEIKGVYSNYTEIKHTKEEFCLDFLNIFPPMGSLTARVIMSPGHTKRMINAMQDNVKKYEEQFGKIEEAKGPETTKMGFNMQ